MKRTLIRENLNFSVEERFRRAMALARFAKEPRRPERKVTPAMTDFEGLPHTLSRHKRAAGRPRDLEGLAGLEAIQGEEEGI